MALVTINRYTVACVTGRSMSISNLESSCLLLGPRAKPRSTQSFQSAVSLAYPPRLLDRPPASPASQTKQYTAWTAHLLTSSIPSLFQVLFLVFLFRRSLFGAYTGPYDMPCMPSMSIACLITYLTTAVPPSARPVPRSPTTAHPSFTPPFTYLSTIVLK